MDNYYFKLVCVDEQHPLGYCILEDVNLNLEDVHEYVEDHINNHPLDTIKWMIKPNVAIAQNKKKTCNLKGKSF